ncbi:glycosyltransferase family 4 protein [Niallia sp. MER TA 168]|uniref:glycosyltransferase family 4 protein n=1 Tax=Niallia sp. MER TA 168 TaxID=2939568 RepID=UPI00203DE9A2|nr:glycosyltransferase family 4 protein [Niallia sp. MER TA 168]MCM3363557.1 glycosyltransferase family 4 protein [Niallia sp. MER TA 168]
MYEKGEILLTGFKFPHHSTSSGYHHLASYINGEYLDANKILFGSIPMESKARLLNFLCFEFFLKFKVNKYNVVHYLYPEQHLLFSVPEGKDKIISIATIHLDEQWLDRNIKSNKKFINTRRNAYEQLDGIICLSNDQALRLKKIYPKKNIKFIPHGINKLGSYAKCDINRDIFYITVVGSNYRDKQVLFNIIKLSEKLFPNWKFNFIGVSKEWKKEASNFSNIIIHPFLSEIQYFEIMQASHVHLLPVEFATANNALLEAHALGVPSLTSSCLGILDYSIKSTSHFTDEQEAIAILESIYNMSNTDYLSLREDTKNEAEKFEWTQISKEVLQFYHEVEKNKHK